MSQKKNLPKKNLKLERIIAEINKKHGENIIGRLSDMKNITTDRIPSGIKSLDDAVGGGFPMRRMVELYGIPSSGKSLVAMKIIAEAQKIGKECVYMDVEDAFDPIFAKALGINLDQLVIVQSSVGEPTLDILCKLLPSKPGVIVVDSVAALVTLAEMEEESFEKQFMAPKARLLSRGLAKINALNQGTLIIFINQLRSTMAMYGPPTTVTGGRALGHYASVRLEIKKTELLYEDDKKTKRVIGQIVGYRVTKNKTAAPFATGSFKFIYEGAKIE